MNIQLKKGLVEMCVLSILNKEPSYGYRIIADMEEIMSLSESTLYPILRRLETSKLLTTFSRDYNGRLRKYYQITGEGRLRLRDFKDEWHEMESVYRFIAKREVHSYE